MTSFVVPAWNEADLLGATVDAIHSTARTLGEPYEIIVADDGSTDETAAVAEHHGARVVRGGFDETYFGGEEVIMSRALKRQGPFVVLTHAVMTSGRKLRTYSVLEVWGLLIRMGLRGSKSIKQREGMEMWYGPRRCDPGQDG